MHWRPPIFRSATYFIAHRSVKCRHCRGSTRVVALVLPVGHEVLQDNEEEGPAHPEQQSEWQKVSAPALIFGLGELPMSVEVQLRRLAPAFGWTTESITNNAVWSNYCEFCGTCFDDEELHCEPGDSFVPMSEAEGSKISLVEIVEPIEVWAYGYSLDSLYLSFNRHC